MSLLPYCGDVGRVCHLWCRRSLPQHFVAGGSCVYSFCLHGWYRILQWTCSSIKNESWRVEDDQIPPQC